ncbi:MAG: insulinase family protein, partial [Desulfobacterales bacterium]|nr:insulinase family protein [Desulfobacterales bacterium]
MKMSQRLFRKPLWQCICQAGTFSIIAAAALAFLVSACNTLPANTTTSPHEPLPFSERILSGTLENGLRYYIQENPYPEDRVEIRLNVRTGSLNETDEEQGLAHFVEHMAFNGTKHFKANELITFLEKAGLTFGSHTNA